jgi:nickel superoxide dismutase
MKARWMAITAAVALAAGTAGAHCEIPCGIYDDDARLAAIAEHIDTIEKSMDQIRILGAAEDVNYNQLVRWIGNKDDHAAKLQEIVTQYFMTQRIKPTDSEQDRPVYVRQLTLLHGMLVEAMKAKQTTDDAHIAALRRLLGEFRAVYPAPVATETTHAHDGHE